jgi:hypothetical protein
MVSLTLSSKARASAAEEGRRDDVDSEEDAASDTHESSEDTDADDGIVQPSSASGDGKKQRKLRRLLSELPLLLDAADAAFDAESRATGRFHLTLQMAAARKELQEASLFGQFLRWARSSAQQRKLNNAGPFVRALLTRPDANIAIILSTRAEWMDQGREVHTLNPLAQPQTGPWRWANQLDELMVAFGEALQEERRRASRIRREAVQAEQCRRARRARWRRGQQRKLKANRKKLLMTLNAGLRRKEVAMKRRHQRQLDEEHGWRREMETDEQDSIRQEAEFRREEAEEAKEARQRERSMRVRVAREAEEQQLRDSERSLAVEAAVRALRRMRTAEARRIDKKAKAAAGAGPEAEGQIELRRLELSLRYDSASSSPRTGTAAPGELWAMQEEDWASQDAEVTARSAENQPQEEEEERQQQSALQKAKDIRETYRREMGEQRDEQQRKQQVMLRRRRQRTAEWRGLRQEQELALKGNKLWYDCKQKILRRVDALVLVRKAEEARLRSGGTVLFKDKDFDSEKDRAREERVLWSRVAKLLYNNSTSGVMSKRKRGKGQVEWMRPSELELSALGLDAQLEVGLQGLSIPPNVGVFVGSRPKKRTPKAAGAGAIVRAKGRGEHDPAHEKQWVCQSFLADRWLVSAISIVASHDDHTRWLTARASSGGTSTIVPGRQQNASDDSDDEEDEENGAAGAHETLPLLQAQAGGLRPNLLERLFLSKTINSCGAYALQLSMPAAGWEHVLLDDRLPCYSHTVTSKKGQKVDSNKAAAAWRPACGYNVSSDCNADGHPVHRLEVLTALLEKAFAKVYGGYPALAGGMVHTALEALTGGIGEELELGSSDCALGMLDGSLWHRLIHCHRMGHILCVGRPSSSNNGTGSTSGGAREGDGPDDGEVLQIVRMEQVQTGTVGTLISGWAAGGASVAAAAAVGRAGQQLRLVQVQVPRLRTPGARGKGGGSRRRNNEHEINWHGLWRQRRRREWDSVARSDELRGPGGAAALRRARAKVANGAESRTTSNHLNKGEGVYINGKWVDKTAKLKEKDDNAKSDTHTFWLPFEALMAAHQSVFVCRLHRTRREGGLWHKYVANGRWKALPPLVAGAEELGETATLASAGRGAREREREQQQQQQQQWRTLHSPQYQLHVDDTVTNLFVKLTLVRKEKEGDGAGVDADDDTTPGSPMNQAVGGMDGSILYDMGVAGDNKEENIKVSMGIFVLDCFGRRARAVVRRHVVAGSIVSSDDASSAGGVGDASGDVGESNDPIGGGHPRSFCAKTSSIGGRGDAEEIFLEVANLRPQKEPYTLLPCTREAVDASFRIEVFTDVPLRGGKRAGDQGEEVPLQELPVPSQYACADLEVDSSEGHSMSSQSASYGSDEEVDEGERAEDVDAWAAEEEAVSKMTEEELLRDSTDEDEEDGGGDEKQEEDEDEDKDEEESVESQSDTETATGESEESDPEAEIKASAASARVDPQARQQWEESVKPAGFRPAARGPAVGDGANARADQPRGEAERERQPPPQEKESEEESEEESEDEDMDPEDALLSLAQHAVAIVLPQLAPHEDELQQMADVVMDEAMEKFNGEFDEAGYYIQAAINAPMLLGVTGDSSLLEAKKKFRKLALKHHPDKVDA